MRVWNDNSMNLDGIFAHLNLIYAQTEPGPEGSPMGGLMQMLPMFVAFIAIMYFLMIRPQQKRDRERREMLGALKKGDEVVTTGGACGKIVGINDTHVVLQVDEKTKIEFVRGAIHQVVKEGE